MALAKKCDRCKKLYESKSIPFKRKNLVNGVCLVEIENDGRSYSQKGFYDLCPDCLKELYIWLYGEEKEE